VSPWSAPCSASSTPATRHRTRACIPLPDNPNIDIGCDDVANLRRLFGADYGTNPSAPTIDYEVGVLLDGVGDDRSTRPLR
jgi:hypothetical protein